MQALADALVKKELEAKKKKHSRRFDDSGRCLRRGFYTSERKKFRQEVAYGVHSAYCTVQVPHRVPSMMPWAYLSLEWAAYLVAA